MFRRESAQLVLLLLISLRNSFHKYSIRFICRPWKTTISVFGSEFPARRRSKCLGTIDCHFRVGLFWRAICMCKYRTRSWHHQICESPKTSEIRCVSRFETDSIILVRILNRFFNQFQSTISRRSSSCDGFTWMDVECWFAQNHHIAQWCMRPNVDAFQRAVGTSNGTRLVPVDCEWPLRHANIEHCRICWSETKENSGVSSMWRSWSKWKKYESECNVADKFQNNILLILNHPFPQTRSSDTAPVVAAYKPKHPLSSHWLMS